MKNIVYFGDFRVFYSTELYISHALTELGYNVIKIQEDGARWSHPQIVVDDIVKLDPFLVMFSKGRPLGDSEWVIETLKQKGIKTVCWLFDLYFDLPNDRKFRLEKKMAPFNSELICSTDGGHDSNFAELGINHKLLRQGIHEPDAILYEREMKHDVIFVGGNIYRTRTMLLEMLKSHYGEKFERFGDTKDTTIRGLPLNELYASTKIVVGDSQPSKNYWSNRIYETIGRGGFLLHPYVDGIESEFEDGKHLVLYKYGDMDDLFQKIDYYLEHNEEREKIRRAGHELVKTKYTYKERCKQLIKYVEKL